MLAAITGLIGVVLGWWNATRRGGNTADKLQYAAANGIAFLVLGYFLGLFLVKLGIV